PADDVLTQTNPLNTKRRQLHSSPTRRSSDLYLIGTSSLCDVHRSGTPRHGRRWPSPMPPQHDRDTSVPSPRGRPKPRRRTGALSDRKSTRLNSSHVKISYAVFCLKKKKEQVT